MADHVQVAGETGHQVAGAVSVVELHILTLEVAVNHRTDIGGQSSTGFFTQHDHDVANAGTQKGKADHDGYQRNQQLNLRGLSLCGRQDLIHDLAGDCGIDQLKQRHDDHQAHGCDKLLSVALHIFPDPFDREHTIHLPFQGNECDADADQFTTGAPLL